VGGFVLVMLGHAALSGVNLFRPRWTAARAGFRLAIDCAGGVVFCWLLKAGVLREVFVATAPRAKTDGLVAAVSAGISNLFPFAVLVCAIIVIVDARRILRAAEKAPGKGKTESGSPTPPK
jgi:hypothetical protein